MDLTLATPSLLFPAISLLLLAYTNRFLGLAALIRELHAKYVERPDRIIWRQIANLRRRVLLIRNMQVAGAASLLLCVMCMFLLFGGLFTAAQYTFGASVDDAVAGVIDPGDPDLGAAASSGTERHGRRARR